MVNSLERWLVRLPPIRTYGVHCDSSPPFRCRFTIKTFFFLFDIEMNFMEEINKETQAMLKQLNIRKAEKKANAKKRIAELEKLIKFWKQDLWSVRSAQVLK